jgi:Family of unknown function (DUF5681)
VKAGTKKRDYSDGFKKQQFKPGQSGNPTGKIPLTDAEKALRRITLQNYTEVIELALTGKEAELEALAEDPDTPVLQKGIARAILKAVEDGDPSVLERFAARIVGEIPKHLNINGLVNVNHAVTVIPPEIAARALKKIEEDV